jgi:hypothetical protein
VKKNTRHSGPSGNAENNMESGVLYKPLSGRTSGNGSMSSLARQCQQELRDDMRTHTESACAKYADFLGIGKLAKKVWEKAKQNWIKAWKAIKKWATKHATAIKKSLCTVSGWGTGLLVGVGSGFLTEDPFLGGAMGIAAEQGVKYACEH